MGRAILAFVFMLGLSAVQAAQLPISMVYSNSSSQALPLELFTKGKWTPDPDARYVKLHLYLDRPVKLSGFELLPCGKALSGDVTVFANFDEWLWKIDADAAIPEPLESKNQAKSVKGGIDPEMDVRSLTFNFEQNQGFALCGLKLYDKARQAFDIVVPKIVDGKASASSTLDPQFAYDVMNLFDSRFESAWASNKQAANVELKFDFDQPQTLTRLRIWSGYQRSPEHCIANSRPKILRIDGDNGYSVKVAVQDIMGAQEIALPKPYTGKALRITAEESFRGKTYADLVISELRFGNAGGWFMLDPLPHIRQGIAENRKQFRDAKLQAVLDNGLHAGENTQLRLRSDGSFYLSGSRETHSDGTLNYFAIGNYEIKTNDPVKGLQLRLFGLFHETAAYGDCNGCGRDCNRPAADKEKIFQELVWLKPGAKNQVLFDPSGGKRLGKLPVMFKPD